MNIFKKFFTDLDNKVGDIDSLVAVPYTADLSNIIAYLQTDYYHVYSGSLT